MSRPGRFVSIAANAPRPVVVHADDNGVSRAVLVMQVRTGARELFRWATLEVMGQGGDVLARPSGAPRFWRSLSAAKSYAAELAGKRRR